MVELGYYGFDMTPVADLLQVVTSSSNDRFAPRGVDLTYDPDYIKTVRDYVETQGDKIIYIYGAYDTWGACAPSPQAGVDALMMVLPEADHSTRIVDFPEADREVIYNKLMDWLGEGIIQEKFWSYWVGK